VGEAAGRFGLKLEVFLVLRLVSMAVYDGKRQLGLAVEDGNFLLGAIFDELEVFLVSEPTGAPLASVTVTNIFTSLTSTLTVPPGSSWGMSEGTPWAKQAVENAQISSSKRIGTSVRCLLGLGAACGFGLAEAAERWQSPQERALRRPRLRRR